MRLPLFLSETGRGAIFTPYQIKDRYRVLHFVKIEVKK